MVAQGWKQLGLVAVALAAACSEDADCRDNEVRKRGQCVPSSTTEPPGEAGAGGELSPNAGAENGGSDASGAGGDGGAAGGARGGVGGDGGIGGDGGTPNVDGSARWLVFDDSTLYAYDVSRFPAKVPVALVGESSPIWSPDGRWLASFDSSDSNWVVRDMSGAEPGTAIVLGNGANLSRAAALAWSADSRSVSLTSSSRLFVLDPTAGEDSQREVTSTLKIDSGPFWAPRGNKLAYIDEAGSHVIDVAGGVPSEPAAVELTWNMEWSPTGLALVEAFEDQLVYTDLSGPEPVLTELGDHGSDFAFSADGSWLRAGYLFAPLLPQPDAMRLPYDALPPDAHVEWAGWSGDGTWLLYRTYEPLEPESEIVLNYAVKVSGTTADAPILVPDDVSMEGVQWLPDGHRFLDGWQLRDMNDPNVVTSIPHDSAYDASAAIAPTGDRLAYLNTASDVLHIVDLSGATPEELEVPLTDTLNQPLLPPTWSPDGDFIMTHWGLIQIKDGEASAPRLIGSQFPSFSAFAWQPSR